MAWLDVRDPQSGKLLFKYDPERCIIDIKQGGKQTIVDLTVYEQSALSASQNALSVRATAPETLNASPNTR